MRRRSFFATLALGVAGVAYGQEATLASLARRYVETGAAPARDALLRYAEQRGKTAEATLTRLAVGLGDYQEKRFVSAAEQLALAQAGELADYAVYYRALALAGAEQHGEAARGLAGFAERFPSSPLARGAAVQRAESLSLSGGAKEALALVSAATPASASGWMLVARVAEHAGELARAAQAYQKVYYEFPASAEQAAALSALDSLRPRLGARYPQASPALRLLRADKLAEAEQHRAARAEYRLLAQRLKGLPGEQAAVRVFAADYNLRANTRAYSGLKALRLTHPEASAERLYYLAACARRLRRAEEFTRLVGDLGELDRASRWHEEALFAAGNDALVENDVPRLVAYYQNLVDAFPRGRYAGAAHWRLAWRAYLERSPAAPKLLEEHVARYPGSGQLTAALYWLGRLAEAAGDLDRARAFYSHLTSRYPHYYHSLLARDRLGKLPAGAAALVGWLASLPAPAGPPSRQPGPDLDVLLRRARLLNDFGFTDLAERELRFRAESPATAFYAAMELAEQAVARGQHYQAIRFLKRYTPGYLAYPFDAAPRRYWELLFPIPWRERIENHCRDRELDPFLVAALIRQESEFNPGSVSSARARGLMQIVLPTGRRLGRSVGLHRVTASSLHVPETSLQLGTLHLRRVLDQYGGRLEPALAGYNAGEHRADEWLKWDPASDPSEFVESIPFTETRGYVQAVVRNAEMYRRLYGAARPE